MGVIADTQSQPNLQLDTASDGLRNPAAAPAPAAPAAPTTPLTPAQQRVADRKQKNADAKAARDAAREERQKNTAAGVLKEQQQNYEQMYVPLENEAINDLNSTAIIDNARANVDTGFASQQARSLRDMRRYGVQGPTAIQADVTGDQSSIRQALNRVGVMNNATMAQYDRNQGLREQLIDVGRGMSSQATQGLVADAQGNTQRAMAKDAAGAADQAGKMQLGGALASAAMLAVFGL